LKKGLLTIFILMGIALSGCVSGSSDKSSTYEAPIYKSPVYKTINQNIANGVNPVGAGNYAFFQFSVPTQASISGDLQPLVAVVMI